MYVFSNTKSFAKEQDVAIPPSKSELHRFLIMVALSDNATVIRNTGKTISDDIKATIHAIEAIGAKINYADNFMTVSPALPQSSKSNVIDCGESGTTLRFMLPIVAALYGHDKSISFCGHGRLPQRPIGDLVLLLQSHGCSFSSHTLPLTMQCGLQGSTFSIAGNVSSQFISALLIALPLTKRECDLIIETPCESESYISMTLDLLKCFGIQVSKTDNGWHIPGNQQFNSPAEVTVGGDWSNAAVWLAASALGRKTSIEGLVPDSSQGDKKILSFLKAMGVEAHWDNGKCSVMPTAIMPIDMDARDNPDLVPIIAVLATAAHGTSHFYNASRLRLKECDRLTATANLINSLGGKAIEYDDALEIQGNGMLKGGQCSSYKDHRLVMAAAIASIIATENVILDDASPISKSYPDFFTDWEKLGN